MPRPDGSLIPERFKASLGRYVNDGIPTGSFLQCVLENNLFGAVQRADDEALVALPHIVGYVYLSSHVTVFSVTRASWRRG